MLKRILKIVAWFLGIFLLLIGIGAGVLYLRQDQIRDLVFASINENLNTSIEVKEAGISLRKFPNAAIKLESVLAKGSHNLGDTLFYLESVYVEFGIWDVFQDEIPIKRISLEEGSLNLLKTDQLNNWSILKEKSGESESVLRLESIALRKVNYQFQDTDFKLSGYIENLEATGQFSGDNWALQLRVQSLLESIESEGEAWLVSPAVADAKAELSGDEFLQINVADLRLATIENLTATYTDEGTPILRVKHQELELQQLENLYAILGIEWPENLKIKGQSALAADVILAPNSDLRLEVNFQGNSLKIDYEDYQFEDFNAQLEYYRQGKFDRLEIRDFSNSGKSIRLNGTIRQLQKPDLKLALKVEEKPDFWNTYLPEGWNVSGENSQLELLIRGAFANWEAVSSKALTKARIDGKLDLENCVLQSDKETLFENLYLRSRLNSQQLYLDSLSLSHAKSELNLQGKLTNVLSYFMDSLSVLSGNINLLSENFELEDFLSEGESGEESELSMDWKKRLDLSGRIHIHQFRFRNFAAKELKGALALNDRSILGKEISLYSDSGYYEGGFNLLTPEADEYSFDAALKVQKVQVASVFHSFGNFDQETITENNLSGSLSLQARFEAPMSTNLQLDADRLEALIEMEIDEGRLRNYEPMQELSRFAEVEELNDVSFKNLKNTISISNGQIQIPEMAISSMF